MKFTVIAPDGKFCENKKINCPCLGLNGCESEHCGFFNAELDCDNRGIIKKCDECLLMQKMLKQEANHE